MVRLVSKQVQLVYKNIQTFASTSLDVLTKPRDVLPKRFDVLLERCDVLSCCPAYCEPGEALARRMRVELMIPALCSFYIDVFQVGIVPFMKIENLLLYPPSFVFMHL